MRVLLSAFACEPNVGSEPGIGWRWATEIARLGHDVVVLTGPQHAEKLEQAVRELGLRNVSFVFYDCGKYLSWSFWLKFWPFGRRGIHFFWNLWNYPYHFFWQFGAYRHIQKLHKDEPFDLVHHITFGTIRRSSFLGNLGIPFVFGPGGGGETNPYALNLQIGMGGWLHELTRDASFLLTKLNPFVWRTFAQADRILLKTPDSMRLVPRRFRSKAALQLELGIDSIYGRGDRLPQTTPGLRVLYVGRFLYWKGMALGLHAFAKFLKSNPDATLTMIGSGPDEGLWRNIVAELDLGDRVHWISWIDREKLISYYQTSDVLLFPSLHDSSGNVALESLSCGLPIVCLDIGGPAAVADNTCALMIRARSRSSDQVIQDLANALEQLQRDPMLRQRLHDGALRRAEQFFWLKVVGDVYRDAALLRHDS